MADLKDNWQTTPQDSEVQVSTITKRGGVFTASSTYAISQLDLKLFRENSPGTVTIELYAVDVADKPTGGILSSGTLNGNLFTTSSSGAWYSPAMSAYTIQSGTRYVIVVYPQNAQPNSIHWNRSIFGGASGYAINHFATPTWTVIANAMYGFKLWASTSKATVPAPTDAASGQSVNLAQLSWTEGGGANYETVYFGPSGSLAMVEDFNTDGTYDLSSHLPLNHGTTYQWRIDTETDTGTTTGDTWSFTTLTFTPPDPATFQVFKRLVACADGKFWYEDI